MLRTKVCKRSRSQKKLGFASNLSGLLESPIGRGIREKRTETMPAILRKAALIAAMAVALLLSLRAPSF
jgi:hypothetical protein